MSDSMPAFRVLGFGVEGAQAYSKGEGADAQHRQQTKTAGRNTKLPKLYLETKS